MSVVCPACRHPLADHDRVRCHRCGCRVTRLRRVLAASRQSIQLALKAMAEDRDHDAHDFAYEAWGLHHSRQSAAVGLMAAVAVGDPIEIARWIRRRRHVRGDAPDSDDDDIPF